MIRFTQSDKKPELERMGKGKLIRIFFLGTRFEVSRHFLILIM